MKKKARKKKQDAFSIATDDIRRELKAVESKPSFFERLAIEELPAKEVKKKTRKKRVKVPEWYVQVMHRLFADYFSRYPFPRSQALDKPTR